MAIGTMTVKAAAERLGVSTQSIRRAVRAGRIKAQHNPLYPNRIGGIFRSDVENAMRLAERANGPKTASNGGADREKCLTQAR